MLRYLWRMALRVRIMSAFTSVCRFVFRVIKWLPVVFVSAIILWGYYVYVYILNISGVFPKGSMLVSISISVVLLLISHILLALQLTAYIQTIFTKHKIPPPRFQLTDEQLRRMDESVDCRAMLKEAVTDLPIFTTSRNGSVRYCDACDIIKPDRCHHCSICNQCVLKMDHHCPWVNNCVGYSNYKFFILFLFYTVTMCVWVCLSGLYDFLRAWNNLIQEEPASKFQVIICFFVSAMFGFSTSVLLGFHIYLVCWNKTTLENMQYPMFEGRPHRRLYHLGVKRNIQQIFGKNCLKAFLPIFTSEGDGLSFPLHISCSYRSSQWKARDVNNGSLAEMAQSSDSEVELFSSSRASENFPLTKYSSAYNSN